MRVQLICYHLYAICCVSLSMFASSDSMSHYQAIQNFLKQYKRPFTVLDINPTDATCSFALAKKYTQAIYVMMTDKPNSLLQRCSSEALPNTIVLNTELSTNILQRFGECEHIDVVLLLNGLDTHGEAWRDFIDTVLTLGDNTIIYKGGNRKTETEQYMIQKNAQQLADGLYLIEGSKKLLLRGSWVMHRKKVPYNIESTYTKKVLVKIPAQGFEKTVVSHWSPGINLVTFKMCGGLYPTCDILQRNIGKTLETPHTEWRPRHMIIQGHTVKLIDTDDPRFPTRPSLNLPVRLEAFSHITQWLAIHDRHEAEKYYMEFLHKKYRRFAFDVESGISSN